VYNLELVINGLQVLLNGFGGLDEVKSAQFALYLLGQGQITYSYAGFACDEAASTTTDSMDLA
jgi:hypothetical protein